MFDSGVAVEDHADVHVVERSAFGDDHHPELATCFDDHLPGVSPLLVVALHGERANRLEPPQMRQRILVGFHHRLDWRFGAIEDGAGREEPRPELPSRTDHLGVREDRGRRGRRIVRRGHAVRQVGHERPARLGENPLVLAVDVRMHVDNARHDGLALDVDAGGAGWNTHASRRPDCRDVIPLDQDRRVVDDGLSRADRDHPRSDERDCP